MTIYSQCRAKGGPATCISGRCPQKAGGLITTISQYSNLSETNQIGVLKEVERIQQTLPYSSETYRRLGAIAANMKINTSEAVNRTADTITDADVEVINKSLEISRRTNSRLQQESFNQKLSSVSDVFNALDKKTNSKNQANNTSKWNTARELKEVLEQRHQGVSFSLIENADYISVGTIKVSEAARGEGRARKAMEDLIKEADRAGKPLCLTASSHYGASKTRLEKFYRSLGFKPNKGRNRDFTTMDDLIRPVGG